MLCSLATPPLKLFTSNLPAQRSSLLAKSRGTQRLFYSNDNIQPKRIIFLIVYHENAFSVDPLFHSLILKTI